jgi:glycosyltransferase involved in cell wall biosynthesis
MVLLSASMIVRNEAAQLEACLRTFRELVDEIVVVDTGSTDGTKAIARRFGARVFDFAWCDDFSAARNEALRRSRGAWSLYIDADERLRPGISRSHLRKLLRTSSAIGYFVLRHPAAGCSAFWEMRLFRNDPRIRFEGTVHENILAGLMRYKAEKGGGLGRSSLVIDHLSDPGAQARKQRFYLPLLLKEVTRNPANVYCWSELGSAYLALGEPGRAREAWRSGIDAVRRQRVRRWADSAPFVKLLQLDLQDNRAADAAFDAALALFPDHAELLWLRAVARMRRGRYAQAIEDLERLTRWERERHVSDDHLSYDERLFTVAAPRALGLCRVKLGDGGEGRRSS